MDAGGGVGHLPAYRHRGGHGRGQEVALTDHEKQATRVGEATYDPEADALYVRLSDQPRKGPTLEVTDSYMVDLDADGEPVGVELLGVLADAQRHARERRVTRAGA